MFVLAGTLAAADPKPLLVNPLVLLAPGETSGTGYLEVRLEDPKAPLPAEVKLELKDKVPADQAVSKVEPQPAVQVSKDPPL